LYFIEGELSATDRDRLQHEVLSDPVSEVACWHDQIEPVVGAVIEVAFRPGVTDPVADQIVRAAHMLDIQSVERAATGVRYVVDLQVPGDTAILHRLARGLLANDVIQTYTLGSLAPHFPQAAPPNDATETIPVRELDDAELLLLSRDRRAALDLAEMRAIRDYYRAEGREPTDVEFEMIAQTWSEHCVHKTFKARIEIDAGPAADARQAIDGLLKTYIKAATDRIAAPWVRSAFVDNAGIIAFDDDYEVSFKVETHNHPSAIEPFGGANTGVGGVIRDVLGVSARPIAATDVLCFGPQNIAPDSLPPGVLHPRRIRSGVVAGIKDYGNKIGLPTVNGAVYYDPGYTSNPLVFCGCVGIAPVGAHVTGPQPGDRVIVLGGRTGRDGLRGATFSSMTMDAQTGEVAGASVQIGDPIVEKGLIEVITRARDARLYRAITDCGAGGLSSAVGEMASKTGAEIDLQHVHLKYPGLAPWEIWLSEAQERMVLAVPAAQVGTLAALCATYDVELTDIGSFNLTGKLVVRYGPKLVLNLDNDFLHDGIPQRVLRATIDGASGASDDLRPNLLPRTAGVSAGDYLLSLLAHPNIASKADIIRVYDHEILGGTVVKPLTGAEHDGPADACVLKPPGTRGLRGIVLSNGLNPELGKRNAYAMAWSAIDEAIRNAVAVGADPRQIALLDNFCWGDPTRPETLGALVEAARGCLDAALHYQAPFISGKDSLNNEYLGSDGQRHAIPPTLLISAIGQIADVRQAVTMDLKRPGNCLYLLGDGTLTRAPALYLALHQAMREGLVASCHDLSEGGLAVAAAEMCIGGRLGLALSLPLTNEDALFAEADGRLLIEVAASEASTLEERLAGMPFRHLGLVTALPVFSITSLDRRILCIDVRDLVNAWRAGPR
jgi:phosphoribosylformylglycinamidine synthase